MIKSRFNWTDNRVYLWWRFEPSSSHSSLCQLELGPTDGASANPNFEPWL